MKYKGKVDLWWWMVLITVNGLICWILIDPEKTNINPLFVIMILGICDIFMLHMTFKNYVLLSESSMNIVLGVFKMTIRYEEVLTVKKTKNPLSSMALSLDRLEIRSRKNIVFISVKNREEFINDLSSRNPKINIEIH
ncbi:PH domain-containing protein [Alkaliphilus peptidifermentans]|uniref:PH domain-containing protein n=1 Tax=Alkaliphilus peptidifermentans DSM 18978 TaxID=1120976 RepID=A0A1G5LGJ0_9FIRM|nr:PH domain-containing protein [Alkaliphilus peptidifermentans]SCZ11744.1 PH domain-containing protein [Alkaliphilus peptidifermentans DSM 18978]